MKAFNTMIAIAAVSLLAVSNANAGGFLADTFIKPFSPELAREADRLNHQLGNPVDHAAATALNGFVPGAGTALEGAWAIQRSGVLNGPGQGAGPLQQQNMAMGNFCYTPAGRFGPGPVNPIGAPCHAYTPYGPVMGSVGR